MLDFLARLIVRPREEHVLVSARKPSAVLKQYLLLSCSEMQCGSFLSVCPIDELWMDRCRRNCPDRFCVVANPRSLKG